MGYVPLPPPPRQRSGFDPNRVDVEMTVRPSRRLFRDGWEWTVEERTLWIVEGARWPRGFCRREDDAWRKARAAADRMRARHAAAKVEAMRTRTEVLPL